DDVVTAGCTEDAERMSRFDLVLGKCSEFSYSFLNPAIAPPNTPQKIDDDQVMEGLTGIDQHVNDDNESSRVELPAGNVPFHDNRLQRNELTRQYRINRACTLLKN